MLISFVRGAPALLIKRENALVVGDLHIGLNLKFRESGIHFQRASERLARGILDSYKKTGAKRLILLGDVKESIGSPSFAGYRELKLFFDALNGIEIEIVKGNHDGDLQNVLKNAGFEIPASKEIFMKDIALTHGNSWPSEEAMRNKYLIVGHGHYAIKIQDSVKKIWLTSRLTKKAMSRYAAPNKNATLVVVPSFNELVLGSPIRKETKDYLPLFKNNVFSFEEAKAYDLQRRFLGRVKEIIR